MAIVSPMVGSGVRVVVVGMGRKVVRVMGDGCTQGGGGGLDGWCAGRRMPCHAMVLTWYWSGGSSRVTGRGCRPSPRMSCTVVFCGGHTVLLIERQRGQHANQDSMTPDFTRSESFFAP
eukprot:TRINITY_DN5147_c0_g3_i2.p3 TRINITY_DN5147_c0_g3~~TRINITY_DN5147_c0_g3_i2.p3  ORF type:complete len:119 (+),score=6.58 TRINITY_DN5147_c0_g3_i2:378-734(+)